MRGVLKNVHHMRIIYEVDICMYEERCVCMKETSIIYERDVNNI